MREPELVRRGEIVTVRARGPGFRMTDRGTARDSGCLGKVVVVENPRSRKVFPAIVTGPRTVRPLTADEILITDGKGR